VFYFTSTPRSTSELSIAVGWITFMLTSTSTRIHSSVSQLESMILLPFFSLVQHRLAQSTWAYFRTASPSLLPASLPWLTTESRVQHRHLFNCNILPGETDRSSQIDREAANQLSRCILETPNFTTFPRRSLATVLHLPADTSISYQSDPPR
jgi:hypothetical protein